MPWPPGIAHQSSWHYHVAPLDELPNTEPLPGFPKGLVLMVVVYHLESRRRNSHVLVYHAPLLSHLLGVAPSTFTIVAYL